jgi:phage terminase large subunit-like protein
VVSKWERQAVQRHLRDLKRAKKRGSTIRFSEKRGMHVLEFVVRYIRHTKGEWAGQPFRFTEASAWMAFILWVLMGWERRTEDGKWYRRFRTAYISVARKNGKTMLAAILALYFLAFDGEAASEVYFAATKRDQAKLGWRQAMQIVKRDRDLARIIKVRESRSHLYTADDDICEALGRDADSHDGLNPHLAGVDELHAHADRDQWDVLESGMGARREPLMLGITTAGKDAIGLCWDMDYDAEQILERVYEDDSSFAFIARLDVDDDPYDESVWSKPNPNLGVSVQIEKLRDNAVKAKNNVAYVNEYLRKHMNRWTQGETRVIDPDDWRKGDVAVIADGGERAFVGIDVSSKLDLTAAVAVVGPHDDGSYSLIPRFWLPEANLQRRVQRDHVPYDVWVRDGFLTLTDGNVVDQEAIRNQVVEWAEFFDLIEVPLDPWNSTQLAKWLGDDEGLTVVEMRQGFKTMSEPTKTTLGLIRDGRLRHAGHPILRWNAGNLALRRDTNDNVMPLKGDETQRNRIDGMVATILGVGRAVVVEDDESQIVA